MNRKKELIKNTIVIGIGNIFTKAISFLLVPIFTLWLTTKEYGDYDLLYSYVSLVVPFITLQLEQSVLRYTLDDKTKGPKYFHICSVIVTINSVITSIIFGFFCSFNYHIAFTFCSIAYSWQIYTTEYLRGCNELKKYSITNVLCGVCTIIFSFLMVKVFKFGVNGLLTALGLSYLVTSIFVVVREKLYHNVFRDSHDDSREVLKMLLAYSIPLLPNAISWWITNVSDRTMIRLFMGGHYNGLYAVSCKIPSLITVFYGVFNLAWQQSAILSAKDDIVERKKFYGSIFDQLLVFLFTSAFVIIAATPILYRLFLNIDYIDGMSVVPILIWATVILNLAQFLGGILLGMKDTRTNGLTTVVAAVANIVIDVFLIRKIGLYAAAGSTLVSYIIMMFLRMRKLKYLFNPMRTFFYIIIGSSVLVLDSFIIEMVTGNIWQWVIFCFTIIVFFFFNKKMIQGVLVKVKRL